MFRTAVSFLAAPVRRSAHELLGWLAAVYLVGTAAGMSPWVPWPAGVGPVVATAFGTGAALIGALAAWSYRTSRRDRRR